MANREQRPHKEKKKPKADKNKDKATSTSPFAESPNRSKPVPGGKK
ncbi:MAG TPA: hypothetical protein VGF97_08335 [Rhizomicrobium sp.]|jgi:hypothetical protein